MYLKENLINFTILEKSYVSYVSEVKKLWKSCNNIDDIVLYKVKFYLP